MRVLESSGPDSVAETRVLEPFTDAAELTGTSLVSEHGGLDVLAEEGSKVEVSGHQLLLHVLQCPLVFHDLQSLPLTLKETNQRDVRPQFNTKVHNSTTRLCRNSKSLFLSLT